MCSVTPTLESLFNFIKKRLQPRRFPVNIANFKNIYSEEHLRTTASVFIWNPNVIYTLAGNFIFSFRIYKIFSLGPPNLCLLLRLSRLLNISNALFSSSLNRLSAL